MHNILFLLLGLPGPPGESGLPGLKGIIVIERKFSILVFFCQFAGEAGLPGVNGLPGPVGIKGYVDKIDLSLILHAMYLVTEENQVLVDKKVIKVRYRLCRSIYTISFILSLLGPAGAPGIDGTFWTTSSSFLNKYVLFLFSVQVYQVFQDLLDHQVPQVQLEKKVSLDYREFIQCMK